jgi:rhamnosyltransferase subunit B
MKIVLTTFGSFGDLHPYIAIGLGLRARGHDVTLATSPFYREKVETEKLGFHPMRPDLSDFGDPDEVMRKAMDLRGGVEYFVTQIAMPFLRESYEDLSAATRGADLLVTQGAVYAAPLVVEKQRLNWVSTMLQPIGFTSAYDPPVFPAVNPIVGLLPRLRGLGPGFHKKLYAQMRRQIAHWGAPIHHLRGELSLPPVQNDPIMDAHSPQLVLALFSPLLGAPQPDWPANAVQTGFPFYDKLEAGRGMPAELTAFLAAGPPPLVFTLGTAAVMDAGDFYRISAQAAVQLQRRAVLLIGRDPRNRPVSPLPDGIIAVEYAPFSELFPCACALVHQGGVGTTGQAMRAGKPMLVMPYSHDQPDNAARVTRRGIGRTISRDRYTVTAAVRELRALLDTPAYAQRAMMIGQQAQAEDGVRAACDAIEARFKTGS